MLHNKNHIINLLNFYKKKYPEEVIIADEVISLINDYGDCFYRTNFYAHITASAWVIAPDSRILITVS